MRVINRDIEIALDALQHIYHERPRVVTRIDIVKRMKESDHFVHKVLQRLRSGGFVESVRGQIGGYHFRAGAEEKTFIELVKAFDKRFTPNPTRSDKHASERALKQVRDSLNFPIKNLL